MDRFAPRPESLSRLMNRDYVKESRGDGHQRLAGCALTYRVSDVELRLAEDDPRFRGVPESLRLLIADVAAGYVLSQLSAEDLLHIGTSDEAWDHFEGNSSELPMLAEVPTNVVQFRRR